MAALTHVIRELHAASEQLQVAVDRYLNACRTIRESYLEAKIIRDVPQELLTHIHTELPRISSCNTKILQAKAAICQTRNCSSQVVPIHTLPTEVLTRIFQLVVDTQWCNISGYRKKYEDEEVSGSYPDQPVVISHVCSFWRRIIISSSALWSHVDFSFPDITNDPQSAPRLETSINRSGQSLLDVHIDASDYFDLPTTINEMSEFIALVGSRTTSLELEVGLHMGTISLDFCRSVLTSCFIHCRSGILRQVSILKRGNYPYYQAIEPTDNTRAHQSLLLEIPEQRLEDLWLQVSVLRLRGLYPVWSSGSITESQLVAILESSPALKILEFGLEITAQSSTDVFKKPVALLDLELLITGTWSRAGLGHFLKLIAPGPKPLCVSIVNPNISIFSENALPLFDDEIKKFFARSNVTRVGAASMDNYAEIAELLDLVPGTRALGLTECNCEEPRESLRSPAVPMNVDTVYVLHGCHMEWKVLKHVIQTYNVRAIVLWGAYHIESGQMPIDKMLLERELQKYCSIVDFRSADERNPFEGHEWY
ncbi:hypothetical protein OPQ81_002256 [Rhizoctonia solani]|nr:hypothetical protein OPQ81_002256 [Rhizoctonia solani]